VLPEEGEAAKRAAFAAADLALVTSGTVTLEMAAAGTPMVSAYRTSWLTAAIVRRLVRVDTANLVNLVDGLGVVPEFLQEHCAAAGVAPALLTLMEQPEARAAQLAAFGRVMAALGQGGEPPSVRAARSVLEALERLPVRPGAPDPHPVPPPSRGRGR
jgi:lipid-A-disaccharide synthase